MPLASHWALSLYSDKNGWTPRLIRVFNSRAPTQLVGFVMSRLKELPNVAESIHVYYLVSRFPEIHLLFLRKTEYPTQTTQREVPTRTSQSQ